jgi:hypothetical protein
VTRAIIERVNWPCEVLTNFSDVNLGCKNRVASGIDWVFEQVPEAIILEDDCIPHPTFFRFCEELLERYRDDERIAMISGDNFQFGQKRGDASYYFSRYTHIWGWASWRRAWKHYDRKAGIWPQFRDGGFLRVLVKDHDEYAHWCKVFDGVHKGEIDTWDYQWVLTSWSQGQISVIPNTNLISNIGFGVDATHTTGVSVLANMKIDEIEFPLQHPVIFLPDRVADNRTATEQFSLTLTKKIFQKLWALMRIRSWDQFAREVNHLTRKLQKLIKNFFVRI